MAEGIITKQELITEDALQFGKEYADNVKIAIASNEELKKSALGLFEIYKKLKGVEDQSSLKSIQSQQITLTQNATKAYESQGKALAKVDEERQRSLTNLLKTRNKLQNSQESTNKQLIKERETLRLSNLEIKRNLTFMGRLTSTRDKALKSVQEFQAKQKLGIKVTKDEIKAFKQSQKEFKKYDEAVRSIKKSTGDFKENVGNYPKTVGIALSSIKRLLPIVGAGFGLREAFNFTKEARQFAIEAKGVEFAFERIGEVGQDAFDRIKSSTRGLLSDLDIKKAIVGFDNFNISLEETDVLMEFLAVRSSQTGESIEKLQSSLNEGLSKESKLRIDNLGISTKDLNDELEKTPNFVQAVANIAKREVAEAGSILDDAANSQQQWNAAYDNFQLQLGKGLIAKASDSMYQFGTNLLRAITPAKSLAKEVKNEQLELNVLVNKITDVNVSNKEREKLINKLKTTYPAFLQFLDDEKTDNQSLSTALSEVNELYIKRIALQSQQDKIQQLLEKSGRNLGKQAVNQVDVQRELADINATTLKGSIDLANKSYEERVKLISDALEKNAEFSKNERTGIVTPLNDEAKALNRLRAIRTDEFATKVQSKRITEELQEEEELMAEIEGVLGNTLENINKLFSANTDAKKKNKKETEELTDKEKKEIERRRKQLQDDKNNLNRQRIQDNINSETNISNNEKLNIGIRLNANTEAYRQRIKILNFNKQEAIKEAKGRTLEITRLEEAFNAEILKLNKERENEINAIFQSEFQKRINVIEKQKAIEEKAVNDRITAEQKAFNNDIVGLSGEARLQRIKEYEENLTSIKRHAAEERLQIEIDAIEKELLNPNLNPEGRLLLEQMLANAKIALSDQVTDNAIANAEKQAEAEQKLIDFKNKVIQDSANNIANALDLDANNIESFLTSFLTKAESTGDAIIDKYNEVSRTMSQIGSVANVTGDILQSVFSANIDKIDEEIDANEEYFQRRIELAEDDKSQQEALEQEREIKRKELEEKKKKEQIKAAKFQKAQALFQIGLNTAQAILGIWAQVPKFDFGISAGLLTAFVGGLGLAQAAAVLAKPIPKYQYGAGVNGRPLHTGGLAEVSEVRPEIIKEPGKAPFIQRKRAVLNLAKGTQVIPDINQLHAASIMSSVESGNNNLNEFETLLAFDAYHNDMMDEMKRNTKAVKDLKLSVNVRQQKIDIPYQMFRAKKIKWNN
ncbi:hypothetical protein [uncultured Wocania sp.]|uniref:hypothetical protein n=1 Tax=uncultured Wocania sp. TaxID=2834404 RepID=UPI0030F59DD9